LREKRRKILLRVVFLGFLGVILGINFYTGKIENLTESHMPMPFGYGISVVLSGSMEPALSVDDLAVIKKTQDVSMGDIIVYQDGADLIIHRVIGKVGNTVVTKGDANDVADDPISITDVQGKMVASFSAGGALVRLLKQPAAVVLLIVLALFLMERSFRAEKCRDSEKEVGDKERVT
jgi:signal peptidase